MLIYKAKLNELSFELYLVFDFFPEADGPAQ